MKIYTEKERETEYNTFERASHVKLNNNTLVTIIIHMTQSSQYKNL